MSETFEHNGRKFTYTTERDDCICEPWKECDGHGIVSEWKRHAFGMGSKPPKAPGERVLIWERGSYRTYDMQATMAIAKRDGWGLSDEATAKLAARLGRTPTTGDIRAAAVERDFQYLRAWCNDEWEWLVICVTDVATGRKEYLGGVESSDEKYIAYHALDLAAEICAALAAEEANIVRCLQGDFDFALV